MTESRKKLAMCFLDMKNHVFEENHIDLYLHFVDQNSNVEFSGSGWSLYNNAFNEVIKLKRYYECNKENLDKAIKDKREHD